MALAEKQAKTLMIKVFRLLSFPSKDAEKTVCLISILSH